MSINGSKCNGSPLFNKITSWNAANSIRYNSAHAQEKYSKTKDLATLLASYILLISNPVVNGIYPVADEICQERWRLET